VADERDRFRRLLVEAGHCGEFTSKHFDQQRFTRSGLVSLEELEQG
jgi:hypothetical protein